jgi:hypothetical protein
MKRVLTAVALLSFTLVQMACTRGFVVRPAGLLGQAITFSFYELESSEKSSKFDIVQLYVQARRGDSWATIWELNGSAPLDSVTYGVKYGGLPESIAPQPLSIGATYRVAARAQAHTQTSAFFAIDDRGVIVTTSSAR